MILDVGAKTVTTIGEWIDRAATLVWNGPLGAFEIAPFDHATVAAAKHAASRTKEGKLVSVAGGGDTVAALNHAGVADDFTYVSTRRRRLPGVDGRQAAARRRCVEALRLRGDQHSESEQGRPRLQSIRAFRCHSFGGRLPLSAEQPFQEKQQ